ncbi:MAG: 4-hydroxy-tetrahydrodipicolinate synthase [Deltaproteobacteria bacterium]|nr:4-hydroxy-tetrahydrodipicolinate synthase [Deltaproteobacteria bacterium]
MLNKDLPIVWTALITPLLEDGRIDFEALARLVDQQVKAGNGILFLGSTGEALNLANTEKKQILDWVREHKPQAPLMCGVGGIGLDATKAWVTALNDYPFDCYLMVTPPYAKPGDHGQLQWFNQLLDVSNKPCILYNVPGRTAFSLSRQALTTLREHKNFLGIKESSGSVEEFIAYKRALPNHAVYCGDDLMMPAFSNEGACGLISVASNAWPVQVHTYAQKCLDQTFDDHTLWQNAANSLFTASNPIPIKHLLHQRGLIHSPKVKLPLSHQDMGDDAELLHWDKKIVLWV